MQTARAAVMVCALAALAACGGGGGGDAAPALEQVSNGLTLRAAAGNTAVLPPAQAFAGMVVFDDNSTNQDNTIDASGHSQSELGTQTYLASVSGTPPLQMNVDFNYTTGAVKRIVIVDTTTPNAPTKAVGCGTGGAPACTGVTIDRTAKSVTLRSTVFYALTADWSALLDAQASHITGSGLIPYTSAR